MKKLLITIIALMGFALFLGGAEYYDPEGYQLPNGFVETLYNSATSLENEEDAAPIEDYIKEGTYGFVLLHEIPELERVLSKMVQDELNATLGTTDMESIIAHGVLGGLADGYYILDEVSHSLKFDTQEGTGNLEVQNVIFGIGIYPSEDLSTIDLEMYIWGEYTVEHADMVHFNEGWVEVSVYGSMNMTAEEPTIELSAENAYGDYLVVDTPEGGMKIYVETYTYDYGSSALLDTSTEGTTYYEVYNQQGEFMYEDSFEIDPEDCIEVDLFGLVEDW